MKSVRHICGLAVRTASLQESFDDETGFPDDVKAKERASLENEKDMVASGRETASLSWADIALQEEKERVKEARSLVVRASDPFSLLTPTKDQ